MKDYIIQLRFRVQAPDNDTPTDVRNKVLDIITSDGLWEREDYEFVTTEYSEATRRLGYPNHPGLTT
jgi:hypothetical protein